MTWNHVSKALAADVITALHKIGSGATVHEIARVAGYDRRCARVVLCALAAEGRVSRHRRPTTGPGRPAFCYQLGGGS